MTDIEIFIGLNRRRFELARRRRAIDNFVGHNLENQNGRRAILILQRFKDISLLLNKTTK